MKIHLSILAVILVLVSTTAGQSAYAASTVAPLIVRPPVNNNGVKAKVETFFSDVPQMLSIARCESSFQQYTAKGATFTGAQGRYVGVFQIAKGHVSTAKKLGFDIYTLEGNLGYAKYMYKNEGVQPWRGCVKRTPVVKKLKNTAVTIQQR